MCLVRVLAVLKATEIVARRCIFAERGALEDGHPIVARRSGAARRWIHQCQFWDGESNKVFQESFSALQLAHLDFKKTKIK